MLTDLVEDRRSLLLEIDEEGEVSGAFPPSPLDLLIDELGGPRRVAEMTGRSHRFVRDRAAGREGRIDLTE